MNELRLDEMYKINGGDNAYEGNNDPLSGKIVSSNGSTMDFLNNTFIKGATVVAIGVVGLPAAAITFGALKAAND